MQKVHFFIFSFVFSFFLYYLCNTKPETHEEKHHPYTPQHLLPSPLSGCETSSCPICYWGVGKSLGINELEIFNRLIHHFSHLLHAMQHRVGRFFLCTIVMGVFLLLGCEDYSDYPHDVMQSYLAESAKLDSTDTDSIIRFVGKVQRLTQAYPSLQQDPSYNQIMENIPLLSLDITITGAKWKEEKTLELEEVKDETVEI